VLLLPSNEAFALTSMYGITIHSSWPVTKLQYSGRMLSCLYACSSVAQQQEQQQQHCGAKQR
jgi:hypothetical protein